MSGVSGSIYPAHYRASRSERSWSVSVFLGPAERKKLNPLLEYQETGLAVLLGTVNPERETTTKVTSSWAMVVGLVVTHGVW